VCDPLLAGDGVSRVFVPAGRPVAFHVRDDGHDERPAGGGHGRPAAVSGRRAGRGRELHGPGGQEAGLDDPATDGHDGRVLFRHAGVHVSGRRILEPRLRAVHNDVVCGRHGRHDGTGAGGVRPVRELVGRHVPQVPARVRFGSDNIIIGQVLVRRIARHNMYTRNIRILYFICIALLDQNTFFLNF